VEKCCPELDFLLSFSMSSTFYHVWISLRMSSRKTSEISFLAMRCIHRPVTQNWFCDVLWKTPQVAPLRAKRAISGQASATTRAALAQLQQYMKAHDVMNWMAQDQSFIPREPAHVGLILNLVKLSDTFSQIFSISLV
jgi:hypothetical protein